MRLSQLIEKLQAIAKEINGDPVVECCNFAGDMDCVENVVVEKTNVVRYSVELRSTD